MAKNKKTSNVGAIDLETRILLSYSLLEFENLANNRYDDKEINDLYAAINKLNQEAYSDENKMNLAIKYNTEEIDSVNALRKRIADKKLQMIYINRGFAQIAGGENVNIADSLQGALYRLLDVRNNSNIADKLSEQLIKQTMDEAAIKSLSSHLGSIAPKLKEQLARDLKTYRNSKIDNPEINRLLPQMDDTVYNQETSAVKVGFTVGKSTPEKQCREQIRKPFNKKTKPDFLQIMGSLATSGLKQLTQPEHADIKRHYKQFQDVLSHNFPDDFDNVLNTALGIDKSTPNIEEARIQAFTEKSKELYTKMVAGILIQKVKWNKEHKNSNNFDLESYINAINKTYIPDLLNGNNNLQALSFIEAKNGPKMSYAQEMRKLKANKDETAEDQIISIHHNVSVGSSIDLAKYLHKNSDDLEKQASDLVNVLGNLTYVLGRSTHASLEPEDVLKFTPKANMIFAAQYDQEIINSLKPKLPKYLADAFDQYLPSNTNEKMLTVTMDLPENKEIKKLRDSNVVPSHIDLVQRLTNIYEGK